MSVFVKYYAECSPKIKEFASQQDADGFCADFAIAHSGNQDYWIEEMFEGQLLRINPNVDLISLNPAQKSCQKEGKNANSRS